MQLDSAYRGVAVHAELIVPVSQRWHINGGGPLQPCAGFSHQQLLDDPAGTAAHSSGVRLQPHAAECHNTLSRLSQHDKRNRAPLCLQTVSRKVQVVALT